MRYSRRTKNLDVIFCVVSLHMFTRPMRHVNNRIISTSVIRTLCYSCLCLNIKTYKCSRSCDVTYLQHRCLKGSGSQQPTPYKPSNRIIISFHVRSATHVRSTRSGYTAILDRGKTVQVPIPTMGKRNERLGKRNHGNY